MMHSLTKVDPVDHRKDREYRYTHGDIDVDEVTEDSIDIDEVSISECSDGIIWKYGDKVPIHVHEDGVYAEIGTNIRDAEKQAYFALSVLSSGPKVFVDRFRRVQ